MRKKIVISLLFLLFFIGRIFSNEIVVVNSDTFKIAGLTKEITFNSSLVSNLGEMYIMEFSFEQKQAAPFPITEISWKIDANNIQGLWSSSSKGLRPDWGSKVVSSRSTTHAPVVTLYSYNNNNALTFAVSDALNTVVFYSGVIEETSQFINKIELFTDPGLHMQRYKIQLLIDKRKIKYWESLKNVSNWWESMPMYKPAYVPNLATLPLYSTWYSYHQTMTQEQLLSECKTAKSIGCNTIIIDDGWQTMDNNRGYSHCGDWQPERFPEMRAFIQHIHETGLKAGLWYSVPYIGKYSNAFSIYRDKFLFVNKKDSAVGVLDPRFPEVRRYLIDTYKKAVTDWKLDALKLDFVDNFVLLKSDQWSVALNYCEKAENGRDYASVNEAVDRLMTDIMKELRDINPEILIEFRQSYIGPLMRKYGNMFRAGDCPYDVLRNRNSIVDLRLISGNTAIHSDPLMWNNNESVEVAALQLLNTIFSVPQISVKIKDIPESHRRMLLFWLRFYTENRDALLQGEFHPHNPELNYPIIQGITNKKKITAIYLQNQVIDITKDNIRSLNYIINATHTASVLIDAGEKNINCDIKTYNATGDIASNKTMQIKGLMRIEVPSSGLAEIKLK